MAKRVLCLLAPGFEEIETLTPVDLLRRAGAEVVMASLTEIHVTGRSNVTIHADTRLADVAELECDLLLLPGGPGVATLRADGRPAQLARAYAQAGKLVGAICAAPTVLADARLLEGKRFTAHFSVGAELPATIENEKVVEDGNLVTSRGAGTAFEFGLALVRRLFGEEKALEIAKSVMA